MQSKSRLASTRSGTFTGQRNWSGPVGTSLSVCITSKHTQNSRSWFVRRHPAYVRTCTSELAITTCTRPAFTPMSDCCNPVIARDAVTLFHYLTGHADAPVCPALLVAFNTMHPRFVELIRREIANKRSGRLLLSPARDSRAQRGCASSLDHRPLPGTLPHLLFRGWKRRPGARGIFHRIGGLDVPESLEAHRGSHTSLRCFGESGIVGRPGYLPARSAPSLDARQRRKIYPTELRWTARRARSPREP